MDAAEGPGEETVAGHREVGRGPDMALPLRADERRAHHDQRDRDLTRPAEQASAEDGGDHPRRALGLIGAGHLVHRQDQVIDQRHPEVDGDHDRHPQRPAPWDVPAGVLISSASAAALIQPS